MEIKEFQNLSTRTMNQNGAENNCILGMIGEMGEVVDLYKKVTYQGHPYNKEKLVEEIGDVLFYIANYATVNDIDLSDCLKRNVDKLRKRFPNGFSEEDSLKRVDTIK